tara:strand:+ start:226511 stop:227359 length:849 start_codon:yes stop_codon:yes gene_type:complete
MNKSNQHTYIRAKDFLVTGESFNLLLDEEREMLITSPKPDDEDLGRYYESENYISHTDSETGLMSNVYQRVKKFSLNLKCRLIKKMNGGTGSLLDIGAGTGDFLKLAEEYHWEINGVEPNDVARENAEKKGIKLYTKLDKITNTHFDVITLWHVLEHLPNLQEDIEKIERLLKPGGSLIIAVPNYKSFDAKYYKEFWAAYDVPRHLWHFSRKSMQNLFSDNLTLERSKPMLFDSFYVSLLSEKYKSGKTFSIKALFVGLWSNLLALLSKESSSIIYCYRKSK